MEEEAGTIVDMVDKMDRNLSCMIIIIKINRCISFES